MHNLPPRHDSPNSHDDIEATINGSPVSLPNTRANQHKNQARNQSRNSNPNNITDEDIDSALGDLALQAVGVLSQAMTLAPQYKDRIAAANSILDRLGYGRATRAQADQADREIRNALAHATKVAIETGKMDEAITSKPSEESGGGHSA